MQCFMTSQILKSVDFTKTSREQRKHFLSIKGYVTAKNIFVARVTFNTRNRELNFKNVTNLHCMKVKKRKKLLRRLCPTFTPSIE